MLNSFQQRYPQLYRCLCFLPSLQASYRAYLWLVVGPLIGALFLIFNLGDQPKIARAAFVTFVVAFYWMTEALPIGATALLPVVLFPILTVVPAAKISSAYFNDTLFLMLGSFLFATAMERWNLHKKIALKFLLVIGERPRLLMLGFMVVTAFISCWISNTAVTSMMTPLALAVLSQLKADNTESDTPPPESQDSDDGSIILEPLDANEPLTYATDATVSALDKAAEAEKIRKFCCGTLLGVAYAASIGGTSTLIGTGPNVIFSRQFSIFFPHASPVSFGDWMLFAGPLSLVMIVAAWLIIVFLYGREANIRVNKATLEAQHDELGPFTFPQILLIFVLAIMVGLWFSLRYINATGFFGENFVTDGTVSMLMGCALFFIPNFQPPEPGKKDEHGDRILDGSSLRKLPWDILILMGGGMALADAFKDSGLSAFLTSKLHSLSSLPMFILVLVVCMVVLFITELTSNVATITLVLPILAAMAESIGQNPLLLMIPATICSSYAFMLPVATPPNAIVFASHQVKISDMARTGVLLNVLAILLVPAMMVVIGRPIFGIEFDVVPPWVNATLPSTPSTH